MMSALDLSGGKTIAFGRNLINLRSGRGLRQEDVATHLGVATPTYSSWERGRTEPDVSTLLELSRFFDVSVDKLLCSGPCPLRTDSRYTFMGKFHPIKNLEGIFSGIYPSMFSTLYYYDEYDNGFHAELIDSLKFVKNRNDLNYTFYLRRDVKFHSGDQLEPEDVKLSYDLFLYRYPFYRRFVDTVEVREEEHAVRLNLFPFKFLELEHLPMPYIIPRSYLTRETWDEDDECFDGTGPFKVADEEQKKRLKEGLEQPVTLECNDSYSGKPASIPAIEFHKTPNGEPEELKRVFSRGELHLVYDLDLEESDEFCVEKDKRTKRHIVVP